MLMSACYLIFLTSFHSRILSSCYIGLYIAQGAFSSFNRFQQGKYVCIPHHLACLRFTFTNTTDTLCPYIRYCAYHAARRIILLSSWLCFAYHAYQFHRRIGSKRSDQSQFLSLLEKSYRSQVQLEEEKRNFKSLFFANPQPVVLIDLLTKNIILYNKQAGHFFGISQQTVSSFSLSSFLPDLKEQEILLGLLKNEVKIVNYITIIWYIMQPG